MNARPAAPLRRLAVLVLIAVTAAVALPSAALGAPKQRARSSKVTVCHRTHSHVNPYRRITVSPNAVKGTTGHMGHTGGVYAGPGTSGWGDIVPDSSVTGITPTSNGMNYKDNLAGQGFHKGTTPGCPGMTAKTFYETEKAAGQTDAAIAADLQEQGANEDAALLRELGGTFSAENMSKLDLLGATTLSAVTSGSGATLTGSARLGTSTADLAFEYGTQQTLVGGDTQMVIVDSDVVGGNPTFSTAATGLTANRTYYFRALAVTSPGLDVEGVMAGETLSFGTGATAQTITFSAPANGPAGTAPALSAQSTSGLPVTFASTTPAVCLVDGASVAYKTAGTCTVAANQGGNATYKPAAQVLRTATVTKGQQTIVFGPLADQTLALASVQVSTTASSGLTPVLTSTTTSVCTVQGRTVTLVAAGQCQLVASQAGGSSFDPAPPVTADFAVTKAVPVLSWPPLPDRDGGTTFAVTVASTSPAAVQLAVTSGGCTLNGGTVTASPTPDQCVLEATQDETPRYQAVSETRPVNVVGPRKAQALTFPQPDTVVLDPGATLVLAALSAPADSGEPQSPPDPQLVSSTPGTCSAATTTVTLLHAGTCTVTAEQAGDATWAPATPVTQTFQITRRPQTIDPSGLSGRTAGDTDVDLGLSTDRGFPVSLTSTSPAICSAADARMTFVGFGSCTFTAAHAGDTDHLPVSVSASIQVAAEPHAIVFAPLDAVALAAGSRSVHPTSDAALPVVLTSTTPEQCTAGPATQSGWSIALLGAGSCSLRATAGGDATHADAQPVVRTFTITAPVVVPPAETVVPAPAPVTESASPSPTAEPSASGQPTASPTGEPSVAPTAAPTSAPTSAPAGPPASPTALPSAAPRPTPAPVPTAVIRDVPRTGLVPVPATMPREGAPAAQTTNTARSATGKVAPASSTLGKGVLRPGQAATLPGRFLFDFDKATLTPKGVALVKALVANLRGNQAVSCEGYTDYAGDARHELQLSRQRSVAVCTALKAYGAKVRTATRGYGGTKPVVVGGRAQTRHENRRVVVVVDR